MSIDYAVPQGAMRFDKAREALRVEDSNPLGMLAHRLGGRGGQNSKSWGQVQPDQGGWRFCGSVTEIARYPRKSDVSYLIEDRGAGS
ncbi:MAG: hypothetical protein ABSE82_15165 [Nitrososphaerales archaeon]